ncbi:MAG: quinone-dependent dihydroorotate dehydrogenase [Patescibacteria group bacterium]
MSVISTLYTRALKPIFFLSDPETVHDKMTHFGSFLGSHSLTKKLTKSLLHYAHPSLEQGILGLKFANPLGLAAGFDKNAELTDIIPAVGFGFEEIGSVTGQVCAGNPKPRLWRLPESQGLVVYYGLKNDGCEAVANKLSQKKFENILGTSVAMTNCSDNLDIKNAVIDYAKAFRAFADIGDYTTINISCPNATGGQPFIIPHRLDYLLDILDTIATSKPIFIKLSPDLSQEQLDNILEIASKHRVHGIICSNLTKKRDNPKIFDKNIPATGGISGKPVQELADKMLAYIYRQTGKRFVLIGCGGVSDAGDAYRKIRLGASLVQMITGMIFEGPQVIGEINRGLVALLQRDGFQNISEAVGVDNHA